MKLEFKPSWITDEIKQQDIDRISDFSKYLAVKKDRHDSEVTSSQIRKFYGEVKRIQANGVVHEKSTFKMLKPKLAYAVGRQKKSERQKLESLYVALSSAINSVDIDSVDDVTLKKRFSNFTQLFEAIVAYHKFHGGQ